MERKRSTLMRFERHGKKHHLLSKSLSESRDARCDESNKDYIDLRDIDESYAPRRKLSTLKSLVYTRCLLKSLTSPLNFRTTTVIVMKAVSRYNKMAMC
ncbi:hypothetical protein AVEN_227822-1 [Araneus ventricosus]|uniref:Uncharacterized protein n=1 Tax=Araneus ventricosus TaxID=182803 RepID=A0A4Y2VSI9_ARAVE|nr:hypothetical protein AVEN_227822-1 [Araneus ventricosus]